MVLKVWYLDRQTSIISDLLGKSGVPPSQTCWIRNSGWGPAVCFLQALQVIENHCSRPFHLNSKDKVVMRAYKWEGPKCLPSHSRCRPSEEFGGLKAWGVRGEGWVSKVRFRANWESGIAMFSKISEGKLCILHLNCPTNISSFALFLIGFMVQNAEVCFAFFQKFQTATLRAMGCLAAVLCFPGFQLSIEIPHLPTYFYRKPIKKKKFSYSIGTTSNFKMTFLMYFFVKYYVV